MRPAAKHRRTTAMQTVNHRDDHPEEELSLLKYFYAPQSAAKYIRNVEKIPSHHNVIIFGILKYNTPAFVVTNSAIFEAFRNPPTLARLRWCSFLLNDLCYDVRSGSYLRRESATRFTLTLVCLSCLVFLSLRSPSFVLHILVWIMAIYFLYVLCDVVKTVLNFF